MASEERARFAFEVDSSGVTSGAKEGADSLENLQDSLAASTEEISNLQKAIRLLRGSSQANAGTLDEMKRRLAAVKNSAAGTAAQIIKMNGTLTPKSKSKDPPRMAAVSMKELMAVAGKAGGPMGMLSRALSRASGMLGKAGLAGAAVLAVSALVALPAATLAAVAALSKIAMGYADARRNERLLLEGMTRMRHWWGFIPGKASEVQESIDKVSQATILGRDKVRAYAEQLYRSGLRGGNLSAALEATAIKAATQGEEAASRFMGWAQSARYLGFSVKQMSDTVKARLGDLAEAQTLGFGNQLTKLRENIAMLFSTVPIDGFLKAMKKVTQIFSISSVEGKALQTTIGALFGLIFGYSAQSGDSVRSFVRGAILGLQRFTNFLLDLKIEWLTLKTSLKGDFKSKGMLTFISTAKLVEYGLKAVFIGTIGVIGAMKFVVGFVGAAAAALAALGIASMAAGALIVAGLTLPLWAIPAAIYGVIKAIKSDWFSHWMNLGRNTIKGIVAGIRAEYASARQAVMALGGDLKKWFRNSLGIQSPSKDFAKEGRQIPRGVAGGVESESRVARMAVENMVSPSVMRGNIASITNSRGPITVDVGGITIQGGSGDDMKSDLETAVAQIFERLAQQMAVV